MNPSKFFVYILTIGFLLCSINSCNNAAEGEAVAPPIPTATAIPADSATISATTSIQVSFSSSMDIATLSLSGTLAVESDNVVWSRSEFSNDTLTIKPVSAWTAGEQTLIINANSDQGVALDALLLNFSVDTTLPVASVTPGNNSRITASESIVITFSESPNITSLVASGSISTNSDSGVFSTTTNLNDTLIFSPISSWPTGTLSLSIDIDDLSGNALSSLNLIYTVDNTPPTASVSPLSGTGLLDNESIVLTFSENMDPSTTEYTNTLASELGTRIWSTSNTSFDTLTISPASIWSLGAQALDVTATDVAGNVITLNLLYTVMAACISNSNCAMGQVCNNSGVCENLIDADNDGSPLGTDCDDNDPARYPGATEICDGIDNNCDTVVDEGLDIPVASSTCGATSCVGGSLVTSPLAADTICRVAANTCDVLERCDGVSLTCPGDTLAADGAACDDANSSTVADACFSGICSGVECLFDSDCANGACDTTTNMCVGCTTNTNCAAGYVCQSNMCVASPICGNGIIEAAEVCDDGNSASCGTCNASCTAIQAGGDCTDGSSCGSNADCLSGICNDVNICEAAPAVNGCTISTASDMTGQANVIITNVSAWAPTHAACIIVSPGTIVTWQGDFSAHPLVGGVSATTDPLSIITQAGPGSGTVPVDVTFSSAGDFPYFCTTHTPNMLGVVYVR